MITNHENTWKNDADQNQGYNTNSFATGNPDIDENRLDDTEGGGNVANTEDRDHELTGLAQTNNGSLTNDGKDALDEPIEIPDEGQSENEGTGYTRQNEQNQPRRGADTSYSEQIDVTPPERHEFPSEGVATKTDFASRGHGRTTGRMIGHEPGTESI